MDGGLEVGLLLEEVVGLRLEVRELGREVEICACLENSADFLEEKFFKNQFF